LFDGGGDDYDDVKWCLGAYISQITALSGEAEPIRCPRNTTATDLCNWSHSERMGGAKANTIVIEL
jgi:hypothetical protein